MKNLSVSALAATLALFVSGTAFAALPVPTQTVYTLMKCTSFNQKNGTLWASMGHQVSSSGDTYFLTELAYMPPANDTFNVSLSWIDPVRPTMQIAFDEAFLKITFTATKDGRTQSHVIVAMGDRSDPGSFKGNWSLVENGKSSDDLITCTAR